MNPTLFLSLSRKPIICDKSVLSNIFAHRSRASAQNSIDDKLAVIFSLCQGIRCSHVGTNYRVQCPQCQQFVDCVECHSCGNQEIKHNLDAAQTNDIIQCVNCLNVQALSQNCDKCRAPFFRLPMPKITESQCSLCGQAIQDYALVTPPCGHSIHRFCYAYQLQLYQWECSACGSCIIKSEEEKALFRQRLLQFYSRSVIPNIDFGRLVRVRCNICSTETIQQLHPVCQFCLRCRSFETTSTKCDSGLPLTPLNKELPPANYQSRQVLTQILIQLYRGDLKCMDFTQLKFRVTNLLSDFRVASTIVEILNSPDPLPRTFDSFLDMVISQIDENWDELEEGEEEFEECGEELFESFSEYEDSVRSKRSREQSGDEDSV